MGRPVAFDEVRNRMAEFGRRASLISVTDTGTPHTVSVLVEVADDRLVAQVGSRTRSNLSERPGLSLLWHEVAGGDYQLIVDGVADRIEDDEIDGLTTISIMVSGGILHRLAGLSTDGPTCVSLGIG